MKKDQHIHWVIQAILYSFACLTLDVFLLTRQYGHSGQLTDHLLMIYIYFTPFSVPLFLLSKFLFRLPLLNFFEKAYSGRTGTFIFSGLVAFCLLLPFAKPLGIEGTNDLVGVASYIIAYSFCMVLFYKTSRP